MLFADAAAAAGAAIATPLSFSIIVAQTYHSPTNYLPPPPYPRAPPSLLLVVVIDAFTLTSCPTCLLGCCFHLPKRTNQKSKSKLQQFNL